MCRQDMRTRAKHRSGGKKNTRNQEARQQQSKHSLEERSPLYTYETLAGAWRGASYESARPNSEASGAELHSGHDNVFSIIKAEDAPGNDEQTRKR